MNAAQPHFVFFEGFFSELKKRLDYTFGLYELQEFFSLISSDWGLKTIDKLNEPSLWTICKAMFLCYPKDEEIFKSIFDQAVEQERDRLNELFQFKVLQNNESAAGDTPGETSGTLSTRTKTPRPTNELFNQNPSNTPPPAPLPGGATTYSGDKYLNLYFQPLTHAVNEDKNSPSEPATPRPLSFNLRESYFPISQRDMVQSWRFLRQYEGHYLTREWDIEATVQQVIKDGMFLFPVFKRRKKQRTDALVIFADRRGSMVAFHALTDALVQAAQIDAGHTTATVYYFHNEISNVVYRKPGMTDGIAVKEALRKCRTDKTVVLIISDAGAARGCLIKSRISATWSFLDMIKSHVAKVVWLNPMPKSRWLNTSAQYIATEVAMYPILNAERTGFSQAVRFLAGKDLILPT